jgi:Rad3-related DNA helicase
MSKNLLMHFPDGDTPRNSQVTLLKEIQQAIDDGIKFIVVQAPTGSGKSHVAATLSNYSNPPPKEYENLVKNQQIFKRDSVGMYEYSNILDGTDPFGCVVLTVTKALQNQYKELFDNVCILKGKQNYVCDVDNEFDCDFAPCLLSKKLQKECTTSLRCLHMKARANTLAAKFQDLNYNVFLNLPDHVKPRQFIICDEASELEDELVEFYSCTIDYEKINVKEFGLDKLRSEETSYVFKWINDLCIGMKDKYDNMINVFQSKTLSDDARKKLMFKIRTYKNLLERLVLILKNWYRAEYIVEFTADKCIFTPLYVNMLAQDFFKFGKTVILMSGTIIDNEMFAKTLGIDKYKYIEVDSDFDSKKSPIYCSNKYKVNHKNIDEVLPKITDQAIAICGHHKNENGIIHTHSFKITSALQNKIGSDKRFLFREEGITNEIILKEHFEREDKTVLISPSLGFGTDLYGDFGRFQIIMKAPYLPLGSKRIKTLAARNQRWYEMKALVNLVQMCGRTTRSKEDHSNTYILDAQVIDLIKRNRSRLPQWFIHRLN